MYFLNTAPQHNTYPVIVTPNPNGFILNPIDFDDLSVEADNIQYGLSCIQSAIAQKMTVSFQPDPTPVNELALAPGDFVVVVTV